MALLGLGLYLVVVVTFLVASLATGAGGDAIFAVVVGIPAVIVVLLITRFNSWAFIVGALISLLGVLFFAPGLPPGITTPDSFLDFFPNIVGIPRLILAFAGCVVSFFQTRSGSAPVTGSPRAVVGLRAMLGVMAVLSVISAGLTVAGKETVSAADKEGATVITAKKTEWSTPEVQASSSGATKLLIKNSDPVLHTFTVKDLNIDVKIKPGSEKLVVLKSPAAGKHEFVCTLHDNMKGTLDVR